MHRTILLALVCVTASTAQQCTESDYRKAMACMGVETAGPSGAKLEKEYAQDVGQQITKCYRSLKKEASRDGLCYIDDGEIGQDGFEYELSCDMCKGASKFLKENVVGNINNKRAQLCLANQFEILLTKVAKHCLDANAPGYEAALAARDISLDYAIANNDISTSSKLFMLMKHREDTCRESRYNGPARAESSNECFFKNNKGANRSQHCNAYGSCISDATCDIQAGMKAGCKCMVDEQRIIINQIKLIWGELLDIASSADADSIKSRRCSNSLQNRLTSYPSGIKLAPAVDDIIKECFDKELSFGKLESLLDIGCDIIMSGSNYDNAAEKVEVLRGPWMVVNFIDNILDRINRFCPCV